MIFDDLWHAGRFLRRSPVFVITTEVTIDIAVAASPIPSSVVNAVLLRARAAAPWGSEAVGGCAAAW